MRRRACVCARLCVPRVTDIAPGAVWVCRVRWTHSGADAVQSAVARHELEAAASPEALVRVYTRNRRVWTDALSRTMLRRAADVWPAPAVQDDTSLPYGFAPRSLPRLETLSARDAAGFRVMAYTARGTTAKAGTAGGEALVEANVSDGAADASGGDVAHDAAHLMRLGCADVRAWNAWARRVLRAALRGELRAADAAAALVSVAHVNARMCDGMPLPGVCVHVHCPSVRWLPLEYARFSLGAPTSIVHGTACAALAHARRVGGAPAWTLTPPSPLCVPARDHVWTASDVLLQCFSTCCMALARDRAAVQQCSVEQLLLLAHSAACVHRWADMMQHQRRLEAVRVDSQPLDELMDLETTLFDGDPLAGDVGAELVMDTLLRVPTARAASSQRSISTLPVVSRLLGAAQAPVLGTAGFHDGAVLQQQVVAVLGAVAHVTAERLRGLAQDGWTVEQGIDVTRCIATVGYCCSVDDRLSVLLDGTGLASMFTSLCKTVLAPAVRVDHPARAAVMSCALALLDATNHCAPLPAVASLAEALSRPAIRVLHEAADALPPVMRTHPAMMHWASYHFRRTAHAAQRPFVNALYDASCRAIVRRLCERADARHMQLLCWAACVLADAGWPRSTGAAEFAVLLEAAARACTSHAAAGGLISETRAWSTGQLRSHVLSVLGERLQDVSTAASRRPSSELISTSPLRGNHPGELSRLRHQAASALASADRAVLSSVLGATQGPEIIVGLLLDPQNVTPEDGKLLAHEVSAPTPQSWSTPSSTSTDYSTDESRVPTTVGARIRIQSSHSSDSDDTTIIHRLPLFSTDLRFKAGPAVDEADQAAIVSFAILLYRMESCAHPAVTGEVMRQHTSAVLSVLASDAFLTTLSQFQADRVRGLMQSWL